MWDDDLDENVNQERLEVDGGEGRSDERGSCKFGGFG